MHIKKGDTVKILAGNEHGKTGKVQLVDPARGMATVQGLNVFKKRVKPKKQGEKGDLVDVQRPFRVSRLQLVCPHCGVATRTGRRIDEHSSNTVRYCKQCNAQL